MPLYFQSLRSSSSGNCLLVRTEKTTILLDCGLGSIRQTREVLRRNVKTIIDAILISHLHSDHISYYPLRFIADEGITLKVHRDCVEDLKLRHLRDGQLNHLKIEYYETEKFRIGDLTIEPFEIPHHPCFLTCGFAFYHDGKKLVVATDFWNYHKLYDYFIDADFIFVESNHDLQLLKRFPNPNSHYHLSNPKTASFLCDVIEKSRKRPAAVMLGHLSKERNTPQIAIKEINSVLRKNGINDTLKVLTAPPYETSDLIEI